MARTSIDIDPAPYVRSHARNPSGFGAWAFSINDQHAHINDVVFAPAMNYSDAKVWIKAWFRDQQAAGKFPAARDVTIFAQP
jgi:hypothetical protein